MLFNLKRTFFFPGFFIELRTMEDKTQYQSELFSHRLSKKFSTLKKWARRKRISCYRLYDKDIPEIPLAVDIYEFLPAEISDKIECARWMIDNQMRISQNDADTIKENRLRTYAHLYLYERPYETDSSEEEKWLSAMAKAAADVLQIPEKNVITKLRKKQKGLLQYEKIESERTVEGLTQECGQIFKINLSDYLDTGLFSDHRPLRCEVREKSGGKSVLNLFCYTGSFSVYAAEGKARRVESVDLSNTYISWAKTNMELNGFTDRNKYVFTKQDAVGFLNQKNAEVPNSEKTNRYDLIILDPPTFSNSKSTSRVLDINRDWAELCAKCVRLLNKNGVLYFSTNSRRLSFSEDELKKKLSDAETDFIAEDITEKTIPDDFCGKKIHRCWKITRT